MNKEDIKVEVGDIVTVNRYPEGNITGELISKNDYCIVVRTPYNGANSILYGNIESIRKNFELSEEDREICREISAKIKSIDASNDMVNHPSHYTSHPSGVECIDITRHYCFDVGNAIKYLWRAGLKVEKGMTNKAKEIEDLKKAIFYINDRIKMLEK